MENQKRSSFQYLSISYECALAIGNSLNLSEMLQEVIHIVVHKTNAHRGIIWVKNGGQELKPVANAGIKIEDVLAQGEIMDLRDVLNQILKREQFVLRYKDDKDFLQYCPVLTEKEESVLIVPVTNVAILYLVYASREIADEPLANLLTSLSKKLTVAIEACMTHENVIKEIQVREKAEKKLTKKTEQLISSEKELQRLYGESEQARKSLLSILEDVTLKEEALKESESKLNSILSSIDDLVFVFDQDNRFILTQKPTSEQLYTTPDEFIGKKPFEVMPSHLNKIFSDAFYKIREGQVAEYDYWLKIDGKTMWFSAKHSPRFIDGEFVGSVSVVRDITERKQAEDALERSEAFLNETGQMAKVGGWELDAETLEVRWTEETYRIHEVPLDHKPPLDEAINFCHPEDRPELEHAIQRALEHGEPYDLEIRFITASGKHLWAHTICKPHIVDGKTVKLIGTFQDITERRKAEEELRLFNEMAVDRELKMVELKKTMNSLLEELGREPRYEIPEQLNTGAGK